MTEVSSAGSLFRVAGVQLNKTNKTIILVSIFVRLWLCWLASQTALARHTCALSFVILRVCHNSEIYRVCRCDHRRYALGCVKHAEFSTHRALCGRRIVVNVFYLIFFLWIINEDLEELTNNRVLHIGF